MTVCKYDTCNRLTEKGRSRCRTCRRADKQGITQPPGPIKILMIDIETTPHLGYVWDIWNQNLGLNQLASVTQMLCFAAKWYGASDTLFYRGEHMVASAWTLLNQADVVMHYNGRRFDVPHLNREFVQAGFPPPSPYKQIDLLSVVKRRFRFASNKLQHVSTALGLDGKVQHEGFDLWLKCMAGDDSAWKRMEKYNRQDVELLEELYEVLLPWIPGHPSRHLYGGTGECPTCGADSIKAHGYAYTRLSKFRQFTCDTCGSFFRSSKREGGVEIQESIV